MRTGTLPRSSTFRRAVAAAWIAWAPGALVLFYQHRELVEARLEAGGERLEELEEEIFEILHEERLEIDLEEELGEPLELDERDRESPSAFLIRYLGQIRRELARRPENAPGLEMRLALLGEGDEAVLEGAPVGDVVDLMLEETPEPFHDTLLSLSEERADAYEEHVEPGDLSSADVLRALESLDWLDEDDACVRLTARDERVLASNVEDVLEREDPSPDLAVLRVLPRHGEDEEDSDGSFWCLVRERELADGGRLVVGLDFDEPWTSVRRSRRWRDLVLVAGPLLALLLGWGQARSIGRFFETLRMVARRQARGDVRARLRTRSLDSDLASSARTVNDLLDHLGKTVRALSQIGDSIAHDLRTPLSRLQGQLDLLRRHPDPSDELIDAVQAEADQILETFNALLRIAQAESGQKKQGFRRFDLAEALDDVADLYAPVFAEKNVAFAWRPPGQPVEALGDRDLWVQALSNLVENALKYTPEGGEVELTIDESPAGRRIVLRDSGPGIPEAERENVFRRFYRLERHRGARGNGLGLSLVAAVCELHDATITLGGDEGLTVEILY